MSQRRAPFSKIERWCLGATLCCGLLLLAAPLWWHSQKSTPVASVPMPTLPNPNAFDIYSTASNTIVQSNVVAYALRSPRSLSQLPLRAPAKLPAPVPTPLGGPPPSATPINSPAPVRAPLPLDRNYRIAEKAALLRQNSIALGMLRQGLQHKCWNPPARSFGAAFPGLSNFRQLAWLLALEAQVRHARGDWGGSMNSSLDGLQFGSDIQRGGVMITALVAINCEAIARSQAWPNVEHLQPQQARAATKRLEFLMANAVTAADVVREEKWMGQASIMQLFNSPNWQQQLAGGFGASPSWRNNLRFLFLDKKQVLVNHSRYMDVAIANAKLPYRAPQQPLPLPDDPINQILMPGFYNLQWSFAHNETENGLLLLALALHAHRLEQGAYPASLSQLSPRYLTVIPRDPLAHNLAFRYKNRGTKYTLYSVGPDGIDDNGKPVATRQTGRLRRSLHPGSRGDIVAGVDKLPSDYLP
jgi:hypothetical protein